MSVERVLAAAIPLVGAAEALAALGAVLRLRADGAQPEAVLAVPLGDALGALGLLDVVDALGQDEATALLGLVESFLLQAADLVVNPGRTTWNHTDRAILMAQGLLSSLLVPVLQRFVVPSLGGDLSDRLQQAGSSFLDIGTGVGELAIAMCRTWPALRVVGLDPWEPALRLARENVAGAGLAARVELRPMGAEALRDTDEHDLAWVPTFFIAASVLELVIARVHHALHPGGHAIFGLYVRPDDPLATALADLRTARQGGAMHTPQEMATLLERAGFTDVHIASDVAWRSPVTFVIGRRGGP
jgi:SAM-dependent methyltransferase